MHLNTCNEYFLRQSFDQRPCKTARASPNVFKFVFVFVYTVIRARKVRTSLDKKLNAEEFYFYLMEKLFLHEKSCICISLY